MSRNFHYFKNNFIFTVKKENYHVACRPPVHPVNLGSSGESKDDVLGNLDAMPTIASYLKALELRRAFLPSTRYTKARGCAMVSSMIHDKCPWRERGVSVEGNDIITSCCSRWHNLYTLHTYERKRNTQR
jgi:hypothetical protein